MCKDAQEPKEFHSLLTCLLTLALGSVGPLLYLIRRFGKEPTLFTNHKQHDSNIYS